MQKCCCFTLIFIFIILVAHIVLSHLLYDYPDLLGIPWLGKDDSKESGEVGKSETMVELDVNEEDLKLSEVKDNGQMKS